MGPRKDIKIVTRIYLNNGKLVIEDESLNVGEMNNSNEVLDAVKESTQNLKGGKLDIKYIDTGRQNELVNKYEIQLVSLDGTKSAPFTQKQLDALKVRFPNNVFAAPELNTNVNNDNAFVAPIEPKVETKRTSVDSPLKSAEEVKAPEAAISDVQREYEKSRYIFSIDKADIKRIQDLAYAPNPEFSDADDKIFSEILKNDNQHKSLSLSEIANYAVKRGISNLKFLSSLEKAELLADLAYGLQGKLAKLPLTEITDLALSDPQAAEIILSTHFGPQLSNNERVQIINKWKHDPVFVNTIAEIPLLTNPYDGESALTFTLNQIPKRLFSIFSKENDPKTVLNDLLTKHNNMTPKEAYDMHSERLLRWLASHRDDSVLMMVSEINAVHTANLSKNPKELNAASLSSLAMLREVVNELRANKKATHEQIVLRQMEKDLTKVIDKPQESESTKQLGKK